MNKKNEKNLADRQHNLHLIFGKKNFLILALGILFMALGYMLMLGGGAKSPEVFQPEEIYSTMRITVAPILILIGIGISFYAIFVKSN